VLQSRGGSYDRSSRFSRWVERKTSEELTAGINQEASVGSVTELRPIRYGRSGRLAELEVVGARGSVVLTGLAIRRSLGIRENFFFIDRQLAPDGQVAAWVFSGRGWGHGVGLCQVGAYGMAAAGHSYQEILAHYYTGAQVHSQVASTTR
jgi:stage II sporulation protein D